MKATMYKAIGAIGNLLESLLGTHEKNSTIEIIRVYPYESKVGDRVFGSERRYLNTPEDQNILQVLDEIRKKVDENHWDDNKIVVELSIGFHHIFIGFWDDYISVGYSVIPNTKYQPLCKISSTWRGVIEPVVVRP